MWGVCLKHWVSDSVLGGSDSQVQVLLAAHTPAAARTRPSSGRHPGAGVGGRTRRLLGACHTGFGTCHTGFGTCHAGLRTSRALGLSQGGQTGFGGGASGLSQRRCAAMR